MATTALWKIENRIDKVINYAKDEKKTSINIYNDLQNLIDYTRSSNKTEKELYVTGINCLPNTVIEEMIITKETFRKLKGILAFHGYQSFADGETSPEVAHEIGIKLAEEMWGDRFEVLVSTHLNTKKIHNHFVINSVSFIDGKKYYDNRKNYALLRETSDMLCKEYNLSVLIEKQCPKSKINYENYAKSKFQNSEYYMTTKEDIDRAIRQAYSYEDFESIMRAMEYALTYRAGKLSICREPYKRNIRVERAYGDEYTLDNIKYKIMEIQENRVPFQEVYSRVYKRTTRRYNTSIKEMKKKSGMYRLYTYYCYLLKVYPDKRIRKPISEELRKEVKKMDKISNEIRFLDSKNIKTIWELSIYKESLYIEIDKIKSEREKLYYKMKTTENKENFRNKVMVLTEKIKILREEVRICESIEKRAIVLIENIEELENKNINQKERDKNERIK